jgi:hypothetical protein
MSRAVRRGARGRLLCVGVALALVGGAALCPIAAAAHTPGHYFLPPYRAIRFRVQGSHGYVIGVAQGSRQHFTVTVRRGPASTEYESRAPASQPADEVRGSFSGLGSFDVHFTPRGPPHRFPRYRWCAGPGPTVQGGIVRGKIRFRGERGYTRAAAHRATAELEILPGQRCRYGQPGRSKHPTRYTASLRADDETGGAGIHFEAWRFSPGFRPPARRVFYEAAAYDLRGPIHIVRRIRIGTDTSTFRLPGFATAPETAVIEPPAPFTGSATFARTPESTFSWTGDLAVTLPGTDPVPLAGPAFRLDYCAVRSCIDQESPAERNEIP